MPLPMPAAGVQLIVVEAVPGLSEEPPWVVDCLRDQRCACPAPAVGPLAATAATLKTTASTTRSPDDAGDDDALGAAGSPVAPSCTTVPNGVAWLTPE